MSESDPVPTLQQSFRPRRAYLIVAFALVSFFGTIFPIFFGSLYYEPSMLEHRELFAQVDLIMTLGTAALGIAAAIMGFRDLKKMRKGMIESVGKTSRKVGITLGIIGPILSIFMMFAFFSGDSVQPFKDAIIENLDDISVQAHTYRNRPQQMGGGNGSYLGYALPSNLKRKYNSTFELTLISSDSIVVVGKSGYVDGSVEASIDSAGDLRIRKYDGDFQ